VTGIFLTDVSHPFDPESLLWQRGSNPISHTFTFYQFVLLATCFDFSKRRHQAVKNIHEE
jgi:hypothetical protein